MPDGNGAEKSLLEMASFVAQRVQIEDVRLVRATVRRELDSDEPPPVLDFGFNVSTDFDRDTKRIRSKVFFSFDSYFKKENRSGPSPLHVDVGFALGYSLQSIDDIDDAKIDAFGKMNAVYNAWPYVREFVQSMIVRMGLPSLTLPVLTSGLLSEIYRTEIASVSAADGDGR